MNSPLQKIEVAIVYDSNDPAREITVNVMGVPMRFFRGQPRFVTIQQANVLKGFGVFKLVQDLDAIPTTFPTKWVREIILARTLHSLGDMLYASVTPKAIKKKYPTARLTVAVPRRSMPIWFHNPWVDNLIAWDEIGNAQELPRQADLFFDITRPCVLYEGSHHPSRKSRIDIYMEHCGCQLPDEEKQPIYTVTDGERAKAREECGGRHFLGIQLRSNSPDRNWQPSKEGEPLRQEKNKALIRAWLELHPDHMVAIFDEHAADVEAMGFPKDRIKFVTGKDVRSMMAVLERCFMTLTLNSGLLVASGALGVPALSLFGNMNPDARTPYLPGTSAIWHPEYCDDKRSPCWGRCATPRCMERITVEEVLAGLEQKFKQHGSARLETLRAMDAIQNDETGGLTE